MPRTLTTATALLIGAMSAPTVNAEPWVKTYVVEWYESAMHYGGDSGTIEPGSDCPDGSAAAPDWQKVMVEAGYSEDEASWLRDPANPTRSPINGQPMMAFRGSNRQNVYDYPATTPEVGLTPVTGDIAIGLNLDGVPETGFAGPDGQRGIDNAFYRALGCCKSLRGPARLSDGAKGANDSMREGGWTVVIVVSGEGADPANDADMRVGFYLSDDKIVRDGNGGVASDYSFAIKPDTKREAVFEGSSDDGVITASAPQTAWLRGPDNSELQLELAQLELSMNEDGSLSGLLGGYRPWLPFYEGFVYARGPTVEALTWVRLPDIYYALQRYADYSPSGPGGEKTYISFTMHIDAVPAFVMQPDRITSASSVEQYRVRTMDMTVDHQIASDQ